MQLEEVRLSVASAANLALPPLVPAVLLSTWRSANLAVAEAMVCSSLRRSFAVDMEEGMADGKTRLDSLPEAGKLCVCEGRCRKQQVLGDG